MSDSSSSNSEIIEQTEKQLWEIIQHIPGVNVTYGTVRCIVYVVKKDEKEATTSAIVAAKGAIQTAAITAGVVTAPVSIPLAAGVLTGIVAKSVTETTEIIVFFVTNSEQLQGSKDQRERIFYDKIKNVTGIGALYSAVRVPVYLFKKDKKQSIESGVNLVANSGDIAVQLGINNILPNIDDQLQKLILKTARHAIKFLSKKVLEQISQQTLPLEQGVNTVSKVESDCEAILEMTNTVSEMAYENESPLQRNNDEIIHQKQGSKDNTNETKRRSFLCCCARRRKPDNPSIIDSLSLNILKKSNNFDKGHLMILTD